MIIMYYACVVLVAMFAALIWDLFWMHRDWKKGREQ